MPKVIIIGSGFGGSIAAARFCEAGYTVVIYELGEWFMPNGGAVHNKILLGGSAASATGMQQTQDSKYLFRLFRDYPTDYMQSKPNLIVTQGMGVGGGSNVYAAIHLRAPTTALSTSNGWPSGYTRSNLDPYYTRVEAKLNVIANPGGTYIDPHPTSNPQTYPPTWPGSFTTLTDPQRPGFPVTGTGSFPRTQQFAAGAAAAGLGTAQPLPLAIKKEDCTGCGWCVPICIYGDKQTMWLTYLRRALATGNLTIKIRRKAIMITKPTSSTYRVHLWDTTVRSDNYHKVNNGGSTSLDNTITEDCDYVVVACGAMESAPLLARSLNRSLPSGTTRIIAFTQTNLGQYLDGQGDSAAGGFTPAGKETYPYKGAIMMAYLDKGDYIITDVHAFPVAPAVKYPASFASIQGGPYGERRYGLEYKYKWRNYGTNMLGMGVIGKSPSGANITVRDDPNNPGNAVASTALYSPPTNGVSQARSIITALGGEVADTPYENYNSNSPQQIGTVHPTGGCGLGMIVDPHNLQVYNNPGLYVIDGSVFPRSCFRNPSHTIAAIAEKAMDVILNIPGAPTW